jgi:hypothetical protein
MQSQKGHHKNQRALKDYCLLSEVNKLEWTTRQIYSHMLALLVHMKVVGQQDT